MKDLFGNEIQQKKPKERKLHQPKGVEGFTPAPYSGITVNSVSGGKTSAYIAVHYPADYDVFSLVCNVSQSRSILAQDQKLLL